MRRTDPEIESESLNPQPLIISENFRAGRQFFGDSMGKEVIGGRGRWSIVVESVWLFVASSPDPNQAFRAPANSSIDW